MPGFYLDFVESVARFVDDERRDRKEADRAGAASTARGYVKAAKAAELDLAREELNRLRAVGAISEAEYERRLDGLSED